MVAAGSTWARGFSGGGRPVSSDRRVAGRKRSSPSCPVGLPVADAYAKFLRAPGADGMVQMEFVGRVMEESGFSPRAQ